MEEPCSPNQDQYNDHSDEYYETDTSVSTSGTVTWHPRQQMSNPPPMPAAPTRSLLHHYAPTTNNEHEADAHHILHWLDIMDEGPLSFE